MLNTKLFFLPFNLSYSVYLMDEKRRWHKHQHAHTLTRARAHTELSKSMCKLENIPHNLPYRWITI